MSDEEVTLIDLTGSSEHEFTKATSSDGVDDDVVVDERRESFRKILKNTGMKANFDNLTNIFFDHDSEDQPFLVDMLRRKRIPTDNIDVIFNSWFGMYPDEAGVDVKGKMLPASSGSPDAFSSEDAIARARDRDLKRMQRETDMLEAEAYNIQTRERLDRMRNKDDDKKEPVRERYEPIMITGDDGQYEIAKDEHGQPITRKIVEPVGQGGSGQQYDPLMTVVMQSMLNDKNHSNGSSQPDPLQLMKIQTLESEINRLKDNHESALERMRDKASDKENEITRVREDINTRVEKIKDDHAKEIASINERHSDKIDTIEQRHHDTIQHKEDAWASKEQYYLEKMERVEYDASGQVEGLRARHAEDLQRMNIDHKTDAQHFTDRAKDNLESVNTTYNTRLLHRDQMDLIKDDSRAREAGLKEEIDAVRNMSDADRQTDQIIKAASGAVGQIVGVFGKPAAENMQAAAAINRQKAEEVAILQKRRVVDEMNAQGYQPEEIEFVMRSQPTMTPPDPNQYDATYEQMLELDEHDDGMITLDPPNEQHVEQVAPVVVEVPPVNTTAEKPSAGFVRSVR